VVLRSFGKFFGLPGLRLGFAIGQPELVASLECRLGPWAVPGSAIEIGTRALEDQLWIETTRDRLRERRQLIDRILIDINLEIIGGTDLFRLVREECAPKIYNHLGEAGIFIRRFSKREDWLRLGVPGSRNDLRRLEEALKASMSALGH